MKLKDIFKTTTKAISKSEKNVVKIDKKQLEKITGGLSSKGIIISDKSGS